MRLVLATHNQGKVRECREILGRSIPGLEVLEYHGPEPVEDGVTFHQNALIKARAALAYTGLPALADDSGICVDVLGGSPGIFSARWSGRQGDAEANNQLLLAQLADVSDPNRAAHFTATLALALPDQDEVVVDGQWNGRIAHEPRGTGGHGYDPIFIPGGSTLTAAELPSDVKNNQSHRARAFAELIPVLRARKA